MPSHQNDLHLIPNILENITTTTNSNRNHIIILGGDFNRDVALIGHTNKNIHTLPNENDHQWHRYITQFNYQYINTNTTYSRQAGNNYFNTSLINYFYIYNPTYTSTTNINFQQNSNHFPIILNLPPNTTLSRPISNKPIPIFDYSTSYHKKILINST